MDRGRETGFGTPVFSVPGATSSGYHLQDRPNTAEQTAYEVAEKPGRRHTAQGISMT